MFWVRVNRIECRRYDRIRLAAASRSTALAAAKTYAAPSGHPSDSSLKASSSSAVASPSSHDLSSNASSRLSVSRNAFRILVISLGLFSRLVFILCLSQRLNVLQDTQSRNATYGDVSNIPPRTVDLY